MAVLIGEKRSTYAEWEREIVPKANVLSKIASALGVSMDEILSENDDNRGTVTPSLKIAESTRQADLLPDLMKMMLEQMKTQNQILNNQTVLIASKIETINTHLNGVFETQKVAQSKQRMAAELLFEYLTGEHGKKTSKDLMDIWDTKFFRSIKKQKDTQNDFGK